MESRWQQTAFTKLAPSQESTFELKCRAALMAKQFYYLKVYEGRTTEWKSVTINSLVALH